MSEPRRFFPGGGLNLGGGLIPAFLVALLLLAGCDAAGTNAEDDVVGGINLDVLFAPAEPAEIEAAAAAWIGREAPAAEIDLMLEDTLSHYLAPGWTADLDVYAHDVDGYVHYGAVITPAGTSAEKLPVLLFLHGGDAGVSISYVTLALAVMPEIRDEFVVVVPPFRSEPLEVDGRVFRSEGPPSPWDRDVDDTIALLNVALESTPAADADRVVALGFSRGATVGLLTAIRDDRIDGVVSYFGPTDFLGSFARDVTRDMLRDDLPNLPGVSYFDGALLEPLQAGELTIDEVRSELIRRSPVYYVDRLPDVQIHHGLADPVVPWTESDALGEALQATGRTDYDVYFYPNGVHDPLTLNGSLDHVKTFLQRWTNQPE